MLRFGIGTAIFIARASSAAGAGSAGHTARFVLDHAPCDVLLVRAPGNA